METITGNVGVSAKCVLRIEIDGVTHEWDKDKALLIAKEIEKAFGRNTPNQSPFYPPGIRINPLTGHPQVIGVPPVATYKDHQSYVNTEAAS
jgi:hypothetical protein